MNDKQKAKYTKRAEKDHEMRCAYCEMEGYDYPPSGSDEPAKQKDPNAPKRACTALMFDYPPCFRNPNHGSGSRPRLHEKPREHFLPLRDVFTFRKLHGKRSSKPESFARALLTPRMPQVFHLTNVFAQVLLHLSSPDS
jgi:hypothetical protein